MRYFVHALRERLEPERAPRAESAFVRFLDGAYSLDRRRVHIDADEFERDVEGRAGGPGPGRPTRSRGPGSPGRSRCTAATSSPTSPTPTGRARSATGCARWPRRRCARSAAFERDAGDLEAAAGYLERLADLEPFDTDVHRQLIALCLERRRHSEALRRYTSLRQRLLATFGEDVDFTLADLAGDAETGLGGDLV